MISLPSRPSRRRTDLRSLFCSSRGRCSSSRWSLFFPCRKHQDLEQDAHCAPDASQDEVYSTWQHEIKHAEDDDFQIDVINKALLKNERVASLVKGEEGGGRIKRQKRISLTFRAVEKVRHGLSLFK